MGRPRHRPALHARRPRPRAVSRRQRAARADRVRRLPHVSQRPDGASRSPSWQAPTLTRCGPPIPSANAVISTAPSRDGAPSSRKMSLVAWSTSMPRARSASAKRDIARTVAACPCLRLNSPLSVDATYAGAFSRSVLAAHHPAQARCVVEHHVAASGASIVAVAPEAVGSESRRACGCRSPHTDAGATRGRTRASDDWISSEGAVSRGVEPNGERVFRRGHARSSSNFKAVSTPRARS
jgi:hypothetical protein